MITLSCQGKHLTLNIRQSQGKVKNFALKIPRIDFNLTEKSKGQAPNTSWSRKASKCHDFLNFVATLNNV